MKCPLCGAPSDVEDTRTNKDGIIVRRRQCYNDHIFRTEEKAVTTPKSKRKPKMETK